MIQLTNIGQSLELNASFAGMFRRDELLCRTSELRYCGAEGLPFAALFRSLLTPVPDLPRWEQLAGRVVVPTFLGRVAVWQLCKIWRLELGDEILMPAYNCGTEVDPFLLCGCKVVLYRVDDKARIDVQDLMRRMTRRTKVVYVTHYFGWPQNLRELLPWCRHEKLRLVEDCALALFSSGPDGPLGLQGDAAIFSLGKFIGLPAAGLLTLTPAPPAEVPSLHGWPPKETLERTAVVLRKQLQRHLEKLRIYPLLRTIKFRLSRSHTTSRSDHDTPDMPKAYYFDHHFKDGAMPPISRHIASTVDTRFVIARRRSNYSVLARELKDIPGLTPLFDHLPAGVCPFAFPAIAIDRSNLVRALEARGVSTYPFWDGYHRGLSWSEFPEARFLKNHLITLPVNQSLAESHMAFVVTLLTRLINGPHAQVAANSSPS